MRDGERREPRTLKKRERMFLSRFEVARVIGLRALELSEGSAPLVDVPPSMRCNPTYIAALEVWERELDARVLREGGEVVHVRKAHYPPMLKTLLDTYDGGEKRGDEAKAPTP